MRALSWCAAAIVVFWAAGVVRSLPGTGVLADRLCDALGTKEGLAAQYAVVYLTPFARLGVLLLGMVALALACRLLWRSHE